MKRKICTVNGKIVKVRFRETERGIEMAYYRFCTRINDFTRYGLYIFPMTVWQNAKDHAINYVKTVEGVSEVEVHEETEN